MTSRSDEATPFLGDGAFLHRSSRTPGVAAHNTTTITSAWHQLLLRLRWLLWRTLPLEWRERPRVLEKRESHTESPGSRCTVATSTSGMDVTCGVRKRRPGFVSMGVLITASDELVPSSFAVSTIKVHEIECAECRGACSVNFNRRLNQNDEDKW
ncbi:unnamed protein product [Boreogadus saida]